MHLFIVPYVTVKNPALLRHYFEEEGINVSFLSPSLIRALNGNIPSCVKMIFLGSEPANGIYLEQVRLVNVYAMSESFFTVAKFPVDRAYEICPVGKPSSKGVRIWLINEDGIEVPDGETGDAGGKGGTASGRVQCR
jgi:non-ribosomal peptide synthetase component F